MDNQIQKILDKNIDDYETLEEVELDFKTLQEYLKSLKLGQFNSAVCRRTNILFQYMNYWPVKLLKEAYSKMKQKQRENRNETV